MSRYTLFAEREGSRFIVARDVTRAQAAELAECDETWPEGHDAVIAGADGEFYLADEWEPLS
tara:strand:- start:130 stop:315 length:186 start_codon:yes stop_codon:yes gene_type:complete